MKGKAKRKAPQIVFSDGKPRAVILDIDDYQEMLERLEDTEDLLELERLRKGSTSFRKLDDFLKEYSPRV